MAHNEILKDAYRAYNQRDVEAAQGAFDRAVALDLKGTILRQIIRLVAGSKTPLREAVQKSKASRRGTPDRSVINRNVVEIGNRMVEVSYHATKGARLATINPDGYVICNFALPPIAPTPPRRALRVAKKAYLNGPGKLARRLADAPRLRLLAEAA